MFSFTLPNEFVENYRNREVFWGYRDAAGNALGELTFIRTYSRVKDDGGKERWYEVCERVINGMYSIQKDHAKQNRLPWNDNKAQKSAQEAYERLFTLKWTPPGRGLWMMGTPLVHEQKNSAALQNCFTPDTKIVTRSGVATLAELDGQDIEVWAGNDWAAATVQSFGSQNVQRVTFAPTSSRSNVRFVETVTPDHRWELRDGSTTTNLKVGDIVPATAPTSEYDEEGFRHGLIFGDGSVNYRYLNGDFSHVLRLCGDKAVHKELFDVVHYQPNCGGDPVVYHRSTDNMKNLPVGQSQNYVASFIDGWLAADGSTAKGPNPVLASQDAAAIQWLLNNATFAGWVITGHNVSSVVKTNYGNRSAPLQIVTLARPEGRLWTVKSIESLDEPTDVFCAVVPGPERFTLASGIYTSNCSHVSTNDMTKNDPSLPFRFLMEASMLGVGVGYDDVGAKKSFTVYRPTSPAATYVIPDTREGWTESTGMLIDSYLKPNQTAFVFDYSVIRPEGAPIKTFGGVAAGPGPLIKLHNRLRKIFDNREGQLLTATDIADIGNLIGACVVSGNVRRCLAGLTNIQTPTGLVTIQDIEPGNIVVTGGRQAKVSEKVDSGIQLTMIVKHKYGQFEATPNHRVAVFDSIDTYSFKEVGDLEPGDRLVWDLAGYDGEAQALPPSTYQGHFNAKPFTIPATIDEDVAWLIGQIHGDGHIGPNCIELATNDEESDVLERANAIFAEKFGISGKITKMSNCEHGIRLRVHSVGVALWFAEYIKLPNNAIRIPNFVMSAPRSVRAAYLAGVLDSDGRVRQDGVFEQTTSIYPEFVSDLRVLLSGLGIASFVYNGSAQERRDKGDGAKDYQTINIAGKTSRRAYLELLKPYSETLREYSKSDAGTPSDFTYPAEWGVLWKNRNTMRTTLLDKGLLDENYAYAPSPVLSVEFGAKQQTYDIEIADINEFTAEGVVVHNSALLLQGTIDDDDFLNLKNPEVFPERNSYDDPDNPGWAYMSNNSVVVDVNTDLSRIVDGIKRNGEPGVIWMDRTRDYGRMIDPPDYRDHRVTGYNPCLTGDAKLLTKQGWITFADAYENRQPNDIVVDGRVSYTDSGDGEEHPENWKISNTGGAVTMQASEVFRTQKDANIVKVSLSNGMSVRLTPDHLVATQRGMVAAEELLPEEDKVLITKGHLPESPLGEPQTQEEIDAVLMGLIAGDGTFGTGKLTEVAVVSLWGKDKFLADKVKGWIQSTYDAHKGDYVSKGDRPFSAYYVTEIADRDVIWIQSSFLAAYLKGKYGFSRDTKHVVPSVYLTEATKKPARLYVAALAFCDGTVNKYNKVGSSSARIAQVNRKMLDDVQLICLANGIASSVYSRRKPGLRKLPDGHGGHAEYLCKESFEIVFMANAYEFSKYIGFLGSHKQDHANEILTPSQKTNAYATVASVEEDGVEDVYCLKEDERRILCANGITMRRCAEQPLESFECCTLAEVHMNRNESKEDFLRTLKFVYLYAKTVTLMPTHWPKTNAIMQRNRRIGTSVSGIANFADSHGLVALKDWFDEGYQTIRRYDKIYSEWLCVRESIRVTTVKPSGTVSILSGESPGVHWTPGGEYFLRRMRLSKKNPIVDLCREAGYVVEPASEDPENTVVIAFPIHSEAKRSDKEVSLYEKANLAVLAQKFWSDNSVSVTLSFDKDNEADAVGNILQMHAGELKTASFLPMGNDTYPQMPFSSYPKSEYEMDKVTLKKIDFSMLYDGEAEAADAEGEKYCSTDACEVQTITINADTEQREVSTPVLNTNLIVFEPHS